MSVSRCTLCFLETSLKSDRNLVEGSGAFNPKSELNCLDIVIQEPFEKYICRKCVDLLKRRKKLKDGLNEVNKEIFEKYRNTASIKGTTTFKTRLLIDEVSQESVGKRRKKLFEDGQSGDLEEAEEGGPAAAASSISSLVDDDDGENSNTIQLLPLSQSTPCVNRSKINLKNSIQPKSVFPQKPLQHNDSVPVIISVYWPSVTKTRTLSDDLAPLGKALINGSFSQIASGAWKCLGLRKSLLNIIKKEVHKECITLCSKKDPCCLRKTKKEDMLNFSLKKVEDELRIKAPILSSILKVASTPKFKGVEKEDESEWLSSTVMAAAVLLKNRSPCMTAIQLLIIILLQHSGFMVCKNIILNINSIYLIY